MSFLRNLIADIGRRSLDRQVAKAPPAVQSPAVLGPAFRSVSQKVYTPPDKNARNGLLTYEQNPFVNVVVDRVASRFAGQDWFLKRRTGDDGEKIYEHPALDFIRSGSEVMDGFQSRKLLSMHLDLAGEAFLLKGYDSRNRPASYLPLPPNWVLQPAYRDGEFFEVQIPRTGFYAKVPWAGMIWLKRPRPSDPLGRGFAATQALLTEISLHDEIASFFYNFVKNRARPDIIVTGSTEDPLSPEDARAMEQRWMQNHGGTKNAGKPLFSNAPLEVHELGQTMQESQLVEMRKLGRDFILQVYGVQPSVFGIIENANRATAEAADFTMSRDVIEPRLKAHGEALYPHLLMEFPDLSRYYLNYDSPVAEDKEFILNVMRAAPSAFWKNDARRLADHEPDPELDGELLKEDSVDLGDTENGDPNALADGNTDSSKKAFRGALPSITRALTEEQISHLSAGLEDNREALALLLLGAMRSAAAQAALDLAPSRGVQIDTIIAEISKWAEDRASELIGFLNETSANALRETLRIAGDDRAVIGGAVLALFAEWSRERAGLIGTTESNGAMARVEKAVGSAAGATSKVWLTQADERVRSLHRPMHGQVRGINEPFQAPNGETGQGPGLFPSAAMNAGCRCGSHAFSGNPPTEAGMADLSAAHERSLSIIESVVASGIRSFFAAQQRAILIRLGAIR